MTTVAVTGVSHWHSPMHLQALEHAGADIISVCDADLATAERVAGTVGAQAFSRVAALLDACRPDLVVAMGRPAEVLDTARTLILAGVPAVVEKPIGISGAEVEPLVALAADRQAFVAVPLVNRYSALWDRVGDLAAAGRLGPLYHAHFRVVNGPPSRYLTMGVPWMLERSAAGGGCLRNLGIHAIDAFLQFTGAETVEILSATTRHLGTADIEDFAAVTVQSASGVVGTIEAGYSFAARSGGDTEWRISTGNAYLIDRNQQLRVVTLDDGHDETVTIPSVAERYDMFMVDTIERLQRGAPPAVSLADYTRASLLIDEMYRRSATSRGTT